MYTKEKNMRKKMATKKRPLSGAKLRQKFRGAVTAVMAFNRFRKLPPIYSRKGNKRNKNIINTYNAPRPE